MRAASIERTTNETLINLSLQLDNPKPSAIKTGHGFYDHMLESFAKHSRFGLQVDAKGDNTGPHHLVEDVAIVIGEALLKAAGDKRGIERFGHVSMPMDETLVDVAVDFGGRGYLVFNCPEVHDMETGLGVHLVHDIFYALCFNGRFNLHIDVRHGRNPHHLYEAMFKGTAVALRRALVVTGTDIPSTKGVC